MVTLNTVTKNIVMVITALANLAPYKHREKRLLVDRCFSLSARYHHRYHRYHLKNYHRYHLKKTDDIFRFFCYNYLNYI